MKAKKFLIQSFLGVLLFSFSHASNASGPAALCPVSVDANLFVPTLTLYNWPDYMPESLLDEFYFLTGIQVEQVFYESDENKHGLLAQTNGVGIDLIIGSGDSMREYPALGWISGVNEKLIPNLKNVDNKWRNAVSELKRHAVPLLWGTIGIAYRKDALKLPPDSWLEFFSPGGSLMAKISVIDDSADVFGMVQLALGFDVNPYSKDQLDKGYEVLLKQKEFVRHYGYPRLDSASQLVEGKIAMAMIYSGDAVTLQSLDKDIEFIHPKEGTNLWVDYIAIGESSKNKKQAMQFIDFILDPQRAATLAQHLNFASTISRTKLLLKESHLINPIIYPSDKVMENAKLYRKLPPELIRHRNHLFSQVKN